MHFMWMWSGCIWNKDRWARYPLSDYVTKPDVTLLTWHQHYRAIASWSLKLQEFALAMPRYSQGDGADLLRTLVLCVRKSSVSFLCWLLRAGCPVDRLPARCSYHQVTCTSLVWSWCLTDPSQDNKHGHADSLFNGTTIATSDLFVNQSSPFALYCPKGTSLYITNACCFTPLRD